MAQGLLTDKYLTGIPEGSRMTHSKHLTPAMLTPELLCKLKEYQKVAEEQNTTLSQMAIKWILEQRGVTSVLMGVSSVEQLESAVNIW